MRNIKTEEYIGGAAAISRHLSQFCNHISLLSMIGEKEEYLKVFRKKDAIKSSLNWYRENVSIKNRKERSIGNISTTTQFIWGNKDIALGRKGAELTEKYMKGNYNFVELDLGHWLIQEDYDTVSSLILNFIKENSTK